MRSDEFRKEAVVSIRMSRQEKERMKQNAQKNGKSLSEYLADCGMAGLEKQRCRDKKKSGSYDQSSGGFK